MKNTRGDIFTEMKKEDGKFGDRAHKSATAKDHNKRDKHRTNFNKLSVDDIRAMEDEYDLEDDFEFA